MPTQDQADQATKPMPIPKPFHMTKLQNERDLSCFWLTANDDVLRFVYNLNCILMPASARTPFGRRLSGRVLFAINPRYDAQETWEWLHQLLETEASNVELDDTWENAIQAAQVDSKGFNSTRD